MQVIKLSAEEQRKTGCNHLAIIDYTDLNSTAATGKTLALYTGAARTIIDKVILDLVTPFDGTSTTALKLDVGYNGASVDDADAFIDNIELHNDATEILADAGSATAVDASTVDATYGAEESTVIGSLRTVVGLLQAKRYAAQEAFTLEAVFTATTANLTDLTSGKLRLYFNALNLLELRNINGL